MSSTETIKNIKAIRYNSIEEKKKHYNAESRKRKLFHTINIILIVTNIFIGSKLWNSINEIDSTFIKELAIWIAFITAILAGIQTYFKFLEKAKGHNHMGNEFNALSRKCDNYLGLISDQSLSDKEINEKYDEINKRYENLLEKASEYKTSKGDRKRARKSIKEGDEKYSNEDLNIRE